MTPLDFLRAVWPEIGPYALAASFKIPNTDRVTYRHQTFHAIEDAALFAEKQKTATDIFFCVHTLRKEKIWNETKLNQKTGELGAYEVRTQRNMREARCFFFDLDVGESTERVAKYGSQAEALADLIRFCKETHLPKPMVTSSGGGLHVYWRMHIPIASDEWRGYASQLRQLARHHYLRADPQRTTDTASVLRVVGTFNHKRGELRPVKVLVEGVETPTDELLARIRAALARAGLNPATCAAPSHAAENASDLSNLEEHFSGPPPSLKALLAACPQVAQLMRRRAKLLEPEWFHGHLNLLRFCERGSKVVHQASADYPGYSAEETDRKIAQLEAKNIKPTTCLQMAAICGDEACEKCQFRGKVANPLVAARKRDPAPPPVTTIIVNNVAQEAEICQPPDPFIRTKEGTVCLVDKKNDGEFTASTILNYDLYPIRRVANNVTETEQQQWAVKLPRGGVKEFGLDADAVYDQKKLLSTLAHRGVYVEFHNIPLVRQYMVAYIAELQRQADTEVQHTHLGWTDDYTKFVLPEHILCADGQTLPATLSLGAHRAANFIEKRGTLQKQVELLNFYNHTDYIPCQFMILASLASSIFYMTGHHGVIVNASGEPGASKSTSLYAAASLWGHPEMYVLNGTKSGATVMGRNERIAALANLPVCVDEITRMPVDEALDLAMSISQPGGRIRCGKDGVERPMSNAKKATMLLSTANNSLHAALATNNTAGTAGAMRVFEILFPRLNIHTKTQADDFFFELRENYGHIGEVFARYVVQHEAEVQARVRTTMRRVDDRALITGAERFRSAPIAVNIVACEIANQLGLLSYSSVEVEQWSYNTQLPHMRNVMVEEYANPLGILTDYLESINGDMLIVSGIQGGNISSILKSPRGQLLAHYDVTDKTMWVLKKGFRDHCLRIGANALRVIDELAEMRFDAPDGEVRFVVSQKNIRKVLGSGTDYAKAQTWCFVIDMQHPEISGKVELPKPTPQPSNVVKLRSGQR